MEFNKDNGTYFGISYKSVSILYPSVSVINGYGYDNPSYKSSIRISFYRAEDIYEFLEIRVEVNLGY